MHNLETNHVIACILRRNFQKWNIKNRNLMKTFFLNKNYLRKLRPTQFHNDVKNANLLGNEIRVIVSQLLWWFAFLFVSVILIIFLSFWYFSEFE